jgi:Family of unknown function (DUF6496)
MKKCMKCNHMDDDMKKEKNDHRSLKNKLKKIDRVEKADEERAERKEEKIFKKHPSLISAKESRERDHSKTVVKALKDSEKYKKVSKGKSKVKKVMHEYKEGKLHSGSKKGPVVSNPKQAIAIALSEARRGKKKPKK